MIAEIIELIVALLLVLPLVIAWLIYIYSFFVVLPYVRGERWAKLLLLPRLLKPDRIDQYIEPNGMPHHRRLTRASF